MRVVVIALVLALAATTARAEDDAFTVAIGLEQTLDYQGALDVIERDLARGVADRERVVRLHMFAGKLAAGLDRSAAAEDHFARALALSPSEAFAAGTSPKITDPFEAARMRTKRLVVTWARGGDDAYVQAHDDVNGLVVGINVSFVRDGAASSSVRNPSGVRVTIPAGARLTEIAALDQFGNRIWVSPIDERGATGTPGPERPLYRRWTLWAAATVVLATGTGVCAWRFRVAQNEWDAAAASGTHNYTELRAIETRGKHWALATNIGIGTVALGAVVTLIVAGASPSPPTTYAKQSIRATASSDGFGLAVVGAF